MLPAHDPHGAHDARAERRRARQVCAQLPPGAQQAVLVCPLCGATMPARGLRPAPRPALQAGPAATPRWELVFSCPACGLLTVFDAARVSAEGLAAPHGTHWAAELRDFHGDASGVLGHVRRAGLGAFLASLALAFTTWLLLTGTFALADLAWGFALSLIVARTTYKFSGLGWPREWFTPSRWLAAGQVLGEFITQLVVQNLTLTARVFRPRLKIRPGIVAVPTRLSGDLALTTLASLMTLTPDTVTLDIDEVRGLIYVHWIDVTTTDPRQAQRLIVGGLEEKITRWLT